MVPPESRLRRVDPAELTDEQALAVFADDTVDHASRQAAFHELVDRHQRRLFAVCVRILDSRSDAEDAVQEVFVRLARGAGQFRGDAKLSTWLYRVARNVCTDRIRYEARRRTTPVEDVTRYAEDVVGEDEAAASDLVDQLRRALATLDEQSRTLLLMIAVDGLSYDEVAEVVALPVGTVKSRVSRARVRLGVALREPAVTSADRAGDREDPDDGPDPSIAAIRGPPDA